MKISKAKTSNYDKMTGSGIAYEIQATLEQINKAIGIENPTARAELAEKDRTQLKAIAAELETVLKRSRWIMAGRY